MIRNLCREDAPALAELRSDAVAQSQQQRRKVDAAILGLLPRLFFDSPWHYSDLPGLVSEDDSGKPDGMIAVAARQLRSDGCLYTAAIGADLYVAPASRPKMTGFRLLKSFLSGPQDLTICDIANGSTRRIWERLGGHVAASYNLNWIGVFRPARLAAELLNAKRGLNIAGSAARALAPAIDRLVPARWRCSLPLNKNPQSEDNLTPTEFANGLSELTSDDELQPIVDHVSAEWIWRRLPFLSPDPGEITAIQLRDRRAKLLGWYIYKMSPGGIATLLQIAAKPVNVGTVLDHLFARANAAGASAVAGRLQPRFLQPLMDRGVFIRPRKTFTLVHSQNAGLLNSFRYGTAWLSVLDGEAPLNVWNSPEAAAESMRTLPEGAAPPLVANRCWNGDAALTIG